MDPALEKAQAVPLDLREILNSFHAQVEEKLHHMRRVMLIDLINHISCLDRQEDCEIRDKYARLLVIINIAFRAGKFYYDEL